MNMPVSCEKAAEICNKTQYAEASRKERWQLRIHNFFCTHCAAYLKKDNHLTRLLSKVNLYHLKETEKEEMKAKVNSRL